MNLFIGLFCRLILCVITGVFLYGCFFVFFGEYEIDWRTYFFAITLLFSFDVIKMIVKEL